MVLCYIYDQLDVLLDERIKSEDCITIIFTVIVNLVN